MAAVVHDRTRSDRPWVEPPERDDARRLHDVRPASASRTTVCRPDQEEQRRPVLAMLMVVGLILVGGPVVETVDSLVGGSAPAEPFPSEKATVIEGPAHVVQPGETYWSIAEAVGGEGDIRARVDALEAANGGRSLQAGDRVAVPVVD